MGNPLLFIPFRPPRFSACSLHDHDSHPSSKTAKPIVVLLPIFYSVIFASTSFIASCNLAVVPSYANVPQVSVCKIVLNQSFGGDQFRIFINVIRLKKKKEYVLQTLKGCIHKKKMRKAYLDITFNTKYYAF